MKDIKQILEEKIKEISQAWGKCSIYYVGGYVRDEILMENQKDVDLVVDMENGGIEFSKFVEKNYSDICSGFAVYPRFGTAKFNLTIQVSSDGGRTTIEKCYQVECVMPRSEKYSSGPRKPSEVSYSGGIKEDAMRRDFCCNALYKDTITGKIFDPTGHGIDDINNKILRTPLDPEQTFKDDPLRMLRAIRFSAKKGFEISKEVLNKIKPYSEYYKLSMERIRDEFTLILTSINPSKYIWILHDTGLLRYIIPELEDAWGFNQNSKYHSMNLTDHLLSVLDKVSTKEVLRLAALLHDISKYKIHGTNTDGTFSYHNHEKDSAQMARDILIRLKFPEATISRVCTLIENHMIIKQLYDYRTNSYTGNTKTTKKIINRFPDTSLLGELLELINADNISHSPEWNMPEQVSSFYEAYVRITRNLSKPDRFVVPLSGDDIMKRYDLSPGKTVGEIKEILQDIYLGNTEASSEDLFRIYEEEFSGKYVWVYRPYDDIDDEYATIVDPKEVNDDSSILSLDPGESYLKGSQTNTIKLSALYYPSLYTRVRAKEESRKIFTEATDILKKLYQLPGFGGISLNINQYGEISGRIVWTDHRTDFIY